MKFGIVVGTRPEIIKMAPVMRELEKRKITYFVIHTGQHNLEEFFSEMKLKKPEYVLDVPPESAGKFKGSIIKGMFKALKWTLSITFKIRKIIKNEKPDILLYQGDTLAISSACLAGRLMLKRPVLGHVEAGLRTYKWFNPFPEEISRRFADTFSDLLFLPTGESLDNISKERFSRGKKFVVGNTVVDAVLQNSRLSKKSKIKLPGKYGVVFVHRQENVHSKQSLLCLHEFLSKAGMKLIFFEHPTTMKKLEQFNLAKKFRELKNVQFMPLQSYFPFIKILSSADFVLVDSGGLQEETAILKVPCIIWRKTTERPEAVKAGSAVLAGNNVELALKYAEEVKNKKGFYNKAMKAENPFGDGKASERILDICCISELARKKI